MRSSRLQKGVSLRIVAERMRVSAPYLSDLERGKRNWTVDKIDKFKESLK